MGHETDIMIYDNTKVWNSWLRWSWRDYGHISRAFKGFDHVHGAKSWDGAIRFIEHWKEREGIASVQFWGHGTPGKAFIGHDVLELEDIPILPKLAPTAYFWLRTCSSFHGQWGHAFAQRTAQQMGCRVLGYTYKISFWQTGLQIASPEKSPEWSIEEGNTSSYWDGDRTHICFRTRPPEWIFQDLHNSETTS